MSCFVPRRWVAVMMLGVLFSFAGCGKNSPPPVEEESAGIGIDAEIDSYEAALQKNPNNLQALIGLGNLCYQTNRDREAIRNFERALLLDPSNANVRTDLAVCFRRVGESGRAISELEKAIASNPRHPQSRYNLGVILIQDKKDVEGAIKAWTGILENIPEYPYRDQLKQEIERLRAGASSIPLKEKR